MKSHITASWGPDAAYTRHSEGDFLRLKDGRIMFVYSRFTDTQSDDAPSDLVASYSADEGEHWSEPKTVIRAAQFGEKNVMSVSLMRMKNGDVGLFYIVKHAATSSIMLSRSADEGKTYYKHVECTRPERPGYYVLNNDRVERLSSGRIIIPLAFHRSGVDPESGEKWYDGRSFACFLCTDDDGETWYEGADIVPAPFTGSATGLQETGVIEKKNGVLWAYNRTDRMYQYECFSFDGGQHWTVPQPSRFTAPPSPLKIAREPESGCLIAVWNPVPNYNGRCISRSGWGRTPLVYAVSDDDGMTWTEPCVIEDEPEHGYCYPAIFFTDDGCMLIAYCAGGPDDGICLARLTIRKLPLPRG